MRHQPPGPKIAVVVRHATVRGSNGADADRGANLQVTTIDALGLVDRDRLAAIVGGITPVSGGMDVSVLSGGRSNLTFAVTVGDRHLVARRRPLGTVAAGAHDMAREFRVLDALA